MCIEYGGRGMGEFWFHWNWDFSSSKSLFSELLVTITIRKSFLSNLNFLCIGKTITFTCSNFLSVQTSHTLNGKRVDVKKAVGRGDMPKGGRGGGGGGRGGGGGSWGGGGGGGSYGKFSNFIIKVWIYVIVF